MWAAGELGSLGFWLTSNFRVAGSGCDLQGDRGITSLKILESEGHGCSPDYLDLRPQGELGQKIGPLLPNSFLCSPRRYTFSKNRQELTVMEFMKPKLGPVENLFLISGQRHWEPQPSMLGVGAVPRSQLGAHTAWRSLPECGPWLPTCDGED